MAVVRCQCGCRLARPLPHTCPRCGAVIVGLRPRPLISPLLVVPLIMASLVGLVLFALWWSQR